MQAVKKKEIQTRLVHEEDLENSGPIETPLNPAET